MLYFLLSLSNTPSPFFSPFLKLILLEKKLFTTKEKVLEPSNGKKFDKKLNGGDHSMDRNYQPGLLGNGETELLTFSLSAEFWLWI